MKASNPLVAAPKQFLCLPAGSEWDGTLPKLPRASSDLVAAQHLWLVCHQINRGRPQLAQWSSSGWSIDRIGPLHPARLIADGWLIAAAPAELVLRGCAPALQSAPWELALQVSVEAGRVTRRWLLSASKDERTLRDTFAAAKLEPPSASEIAELTLSLEHPRRRPNWQSPSIPHGYDSLCAFRRQGGEIELDFVSLLRRDFASEAIDVDIPWPWLDGYRPTACDWESLGFYYLS